MHEIEMRRRWIVRMKPRSPHEEHRAALILLTPFTGEAVLLTGILLAALVVVRLVRHLE